MTPQQQVESYAGRGIDFDGYYGNQCMDLVMQFCRDIGGPRFWGNAADTYGQYPAWYIPMGKAAPNPGDIAVFQRAEANGHAGHISLVHHNDGNTFVSLDQNWGTPYCMYVRHGFTELIGFMRPVIYLNQGESMPSYPDLSAPNHANKVEAIRGLIYRITGNYHDDADIVKNHLGTEAAFTPAEQKVISDKFFNSEEYRQGAFQAYEDAYGKALTPQRVAEIQGEVAKKAKAGVGVPQLRAEIMKNLPTATDPRIEAIDKIIHGK